MLVAARLCTIVGDVGKDGLALDEAGRDLLGSCDIVIHAAASVTFDAPLDGAVEVNLLGPTRVAETLNVLARERATSPGVVKTLPHLIAVSTAYVNSGHKGDAAEELITSSKFVSKIDWRAEVKAAGGAADEDATSRSPERLAAFHRAARSNSRAAGTALLADKTEQLRVDWVRDRMVALGRGRCAPSAGPMPSLHKVTR